jgi:putative transport protein
MIEAFKESPLLLLFVVSAIGYAVGKISFGGAKLGSAAVLFVGLGFGALDPELSVPQIIIVLGLSMYVYTIGLSSGAGFFHTFKKHGLTNSLFILGFIGFSALATAGFHFWWNLDAATSSGILSGTNTNTPALAGLLDLIGKSPKVVDRDAMSSNAVVGYSISYPMGVLGAMMAIGLMRRWLRVDYRQEERRLQSLYPVNENLTRWSIEVTNPQLTTHTIRALFQHFGGSLVFGRMKRKGSSFLPHMDTTIELGDQMVLVGNEDTVQKATALIGEKLETELSFDRTVFDAQRLFVSNPTVAGQKIASLNLPEKYSAIITRVKRGDMDVLANGDTILELGDQVLVVARRTDIPAIADIFGNSYDDLSQIDLLSFGSGMALGLLLGMIGFALPGDFTFKLGFAGGPLIIGLVLGALRRSGPVVWTLPYSASLTLRQVGLILLLAGIGIRSGHTFLNTLLQGDGFLLFGAGWVIAFFTALLGLLVGFRFLKIPFSLLSGMIANQPAVLEYATTLAGNKLPNAGFTMIFPVSMIVKIILVQVLFGWLIGA